MKPNPNSRANFTVDVKGDLMVITIPLKGGGQTSGSGKSEVIASTGGNKAYATPNGEVCLGLNVYRKTGA